MGRTHDGEVSAVEVCESQHAEPLGDGYEAGVGAAEGKVAVLVDEVVDALPVGSGERLGDECALGECDVERDLAGSPDLALDQVAGFGYDAGGGDERAVVVFEQRPAGGVVGIAAIGGGLEYPRVDDQPAQERPKPPAS